MKAHFINPAAAIAAFVVGIVANSLINSAVDKLVDGYEQVYDVAHATVLGKEPTLQSPSVPSCGQLTVKVSSDRSLYLNNTFIGTLDNTRALTDRLQSIFRVREELHVYRPGVEATSPVPEEQRIEKTVYIKADGALSHGDVLDLIERITKAGADPVLVWPSEHLERF